MLSCFWLGYRSVNSSRSIQRVQLLLPPLSFSCKKPTRFFPFRDCVLSRSCRERFGSSSSAAIWDALAKTASTHLQAGILNPGAASWLALPSHCSWLAAFSFHCFQISFHSDLFLFLSFLSIDFLQQRVENVFSITTLSFSSKWQMRSFTQNAHASS